MARDQPVVVLLAQVLAVPEHHSGETNIECGVIFLDFVRDKKLLVTKSRKSPTGLEATVQYILAFPCATQHIQYSTLFL